jgi:DNA-binding CsgD family transcriptional regulator
MYAKLHKDKIKDICVKLHIHPDLLGARNKEIPTMTKIDNEAFTPKELEVLHLLAEHHTYDDISKKMCIGIGTLYNHIYRLMNKTDRHRQALLIKYAIEHGYGRQVSA